MEKKIIEAKFSKNKWATVMCIIGLGLIALFVIICCYNYLTEEYYSYLFDKYVPVRSRETLLEYLFDIFIWPGDDPTKMYGFLSWIGLVMIITWGLLTVMMNRCALSIYSTRVTGKASFGKQVDLPINQISAIGLGKFHSISVSTSSGRVCFWLIENRDEVHKALNDIVGKTQSESQNNVTVVSTPSESSADEIKKYKDLLDAGIITQEEFEAKKKQLLNF